MQHHQFREEPPHEDPVPDELELEQVVPFDFFGLGQPMAQQDQNDQQEPNEQKDNVNLQQEHGNRGQNMDQLQQLNPWDPWLPGLMYF